MKHNFKTMTFNQRVVFFIDLMVGFICLSIFPTGINYALKIPALVCFAIIYYFCFQTLLKLYDHKIRILSRFFLILIWCMALSLLAIYISIFSLGLLHSGGYDENILQKLYGTFIVSLIGLGLTLPIWFFTAFINFLVLRPNKDGIHSSVSSRIKDAVLK